MKKTHILLYHLPNSGWVHKSGSLEQCEAWQKVMQNQDLVAHCAPHIVRYDRDGISYAKGLVGHGIII